MDISYSLHKITNEEDFSFSPHQYSLFKFGNLKIAKDFGKDLFKGFVAEYGDYLLSNEVYIFPSPYMAIPTASNYLSFFFKEELDKYLFENGLASSKTGKILRNQTYTVDYGNLNFEERKNLIANDTYYIDKNVIQNKTCLFIDDIKITGSHEYTVKKILEQYNAEGNFLYLYFAELINKNISPKIENFFNYYKVKTIQDIIDVVNDKAFGFNTRIIKFILNQNQEDFENIISNISEDKKQELINLAISNDYHLLEEYQNNLKNIYYGNQLTKRTKTEY